MEVRLDFSYKALGLGEAVQLGIQLATLLAVIVGGLYALRQNRRATRENSRALTSAYYAELDRYYNDVLARVIAYPHLRAPKQFADGAVFRGEYQPFEDDEMRKRYDAYAHMVWCFVETVHDRCAACRDPRERAELIEIWATAIEAENRLHRGWILNEMREEAIRQAKGSPAADSFRLGFRIFIYEFQWRQLDWTYRKRFTKAPDFGLS